MPKRQSPVLGDDVFLGAGAKVLGPVTIGDGARIGANAVVLHDIPRPRDGGGDPGPRRSPGPRGTRPTGDGGRRGPGGACGMNPNEPADDPPVPERAQIKCHREAASRSGQGQER